LPYGQSPYRCDDAGFTPTACEFAAAEAFLSRGDSLWQQASNLQEQATNLQEQADNLQQQQKQQQKLQKPQQQSKQDGLVRAKQGQTDRWTNLL
jgi:hypothetical protein